MVFQNYALYPHMTVAENMGFALQDARMRKAEIDCARPARRPGFSTSRTTSTSKPKPTLGRSAPAGRHGTRHRPPAAGLPHGRAAVEPRCQAAGRRRGADRRSQRRLGVTTVYVTHDQVEAMTMGDRVAVMTNGVLQQCDTPRTLYDSTGERLRRRFHRLTGDEPPGGKDRGRRRGAGLDGASDSQRATAKRREPGGLCRHRRRPPGVSGARAFRAGRSGRCQPRRGSSVPRRSSTPSSRIISIDP